MKRWVFVILFFLFCFVALFTQFSFLFCSVFYKKEQNRKEKSDQRAKQKQINLKHTIFGLSQELALGFHQALLSMDQIGGGEGMKIGQEK